MPHLKLTNNLLITIMINYIVIEGSHKNPNEIAIDKKTKKEYGPFINKNEAESNLAKSLIQKNIDDFYHRAWVITKN